MRARMPPPPGRTAGPARRPARPVLLPPAAAVQHPQQHLDEWVDAFTPLRDRRCEAPLPLPRLSAPRTVVVVRHGQSTWNAEGRVQGSSDLSVLTPKGVAQAEATRSMVRPTVLNPPPPLALRTAAAPPNCPAHPHRPSALQLEAQHFDASYHSPLQRAQRTADIVWGGRQGPRFEDPVLREIDLYSFQVRLAMLGS